MTTERYALLEAAAADPDDDTPRLVLSDWLKEHGDEYDHALGEFIALGVQLARTPEADPGYSALLARVRRTGALTHPRCRPWLDHVPNGWACFRRGLITSARIAPQHHSAQDVRDWARVPVEQLWWISDNDWDGRDTTKLANRPELANVQTLRLFGWPLEAMRPLLTAAPSLAHLRMLHLSHRRSFGDAERKRAEVRRIAEGWNLPALDSLSIHDEWNPIMWEPFTRACRRPLSRLHLEAYHEDDDWYENLDAGWFESSCHQVPDYGVIRMHYNSVGYSSIYPIVRLRPERWKVTEQCMGTPFENRTDQANWGAMRHLNVEIYVECDASIASVSHLPQAGCLESLTTNPMPYREVEHFARGMALRSLRRLGVNTNNSTLLEGEYCRRLHHLDWGYGYSLDLAAFANTDFPELRTLHLLGVLTLDQLAPLITTRRCPNLATLVFRISSDELKPALHALASAPGLPHLSLVSIPDGWWVLGNGRVERVADGIDPRDGDDSSRLTSWATVSA